MAKRKVLITNDDGIDSDGLRALVRVFSTDADVYVIAPEGERSSYSHHLNFHGKLKVEERNVPGTIKAYALWGTPVDCVHVGLNFLFKDQIDLVVSGINKGLNISTDIIYSGTAAAAREAFIYGIPAAAVSLKYSEEMDYSIAAAYGKKLAYRHYESGRKDYFLNINIPDLKEEDIKGILVCYRETKIHYLDSYSLVKEGEAEYVSITSSGMRGMDCDLSDLRIDYCAVLAGYVSVSPLGNSHVLEDCVEDLKNILGK